VAAKPIGTILSEAFRLYQRNVVTFLVTCAIVLVPVSLAKSAVLALLLAPTDVASMIGVTAGRVQHEQELSERTAKDLQRALEETDPAKRKALEAQQQKEAEELQRELETTEVAATGSLLALVLGLVAALLGIAAMYGIAVPLATGALTVVVADRVVGGNAGPGQGYARLFARMGKLLTAGIPAFCAVMVGLLFLVIPGLVLAFLFSFVVPVVLIENVGGVDALRRSAALVRANVGQAFVVLLVFAGIRLVATAVTTLVVPSSAFFARSLVEDLLLMLTLPIPILGSVLLYFDLRRQESGGRLDERGIRAAIAA
jgi:hypothetical protein